MKTNTFIHSVATGIQSGYSVGGREARVDAQHVSLHAAALRELGGAHVTLKGFQLQMADHV